MLRNLYFDVLQDDQANYNTSFERWLDENVAAEIETPKIEFERQFVMEVWRDNAMDDVESKFEF